MTATTPPVERVEVIAADTTAAREWLEQAEKDGLIKRGCRRDIPLIELLARHRIATAQASDAEIARLEKERDEQARAYANVVVDLRAAEAESARLREEREFLLLRSSRAGSAYFGSKRWTGMSSNALVEVAFGGKNDCKPSDGGDLAACYRTVKRLPKHLLTDAVLDQLEAGEQNVGSRYPEELTWARNDAEWPDDARSALAGGSKQEVVE